MPPVRKGGEKQTVQKSSFSQEPNSVGLVKYINSPKQLVMHVRNKVAIGGSSIYVSLCNIAAFPRW